jgi:hypothetical protein
LKRGRLWAGLSITALCLTACGNARDAHPDATPSGLTPEDAVARVLASLGDPTVQSADVIADPSDNPGGLPWVRVRLDSNAGDGVKEVWLGELVDAAVGELIRSDQTTLSQVLGGGEIVDRTVQGHVLTTPLGFGYSRMGQRFHSPSDADLRERVDAVANKYGLDVTSVQVLHPLDSALAVTFTVPDGHVTWSIDQLSNDLSGSPDDLEGLFVQLDSPSGEPLLRGGSANRFKGGDLWFAPGQDERFGAVHG